MKIIDKDNGDIILHIGTKRHSGRYPWGSGKNEEQRSRSFLGYVKDLENQGMSEKDIAKGWDMSTTELRQRKSVAKEITKAADTTLAVRLKAKGMSNVAIADRMSTTEGTVRNLLKASENNTKNEIQSTANALKREVAKSRYVDVGAGSELYLGVSATKMKTAIHLLEEGDYKISYIKTPQVGTNNFTSVKVLTKADVDYATLYENKERIKPIGAITNDLGTTYQPTKTPVQVKRDRILVRYGDEGGSDKDGVIELRPNTKDIDLGDSMYAQVRIGVEGNMYMKGMAINAYDIPEGYDMVYNTNKKKGTSDEDVFKPYSDDPVNPFGAIIRQKEYDNNGSAELSALNIVGYTDTSGEEGSWGKWSKTLSSQVLSKQSTALAKQQLDLAFDSKYSEYEEIMRVENPSVKKKLLETFADETDSASVHLKAAALPRQQSHVILPVPSLKDNEVYAPNYKNGEKVVLIRHPHGGIFEIPELIVNNKHPEAKKILGNAKDGIGINPKVAEQLSGADFDGDTVLVIPNNNKSIKTSPAINGLKNFDPKKEYPAYEGMSVISKQYKNKQMGVVSNLITDMTIQGADQDELVRAVKHSMVVIDAEKHKLNWKQSAIDNGISALQKKYQPNGGASTIVSLAKSEKRTPLREDGVLITTETGSTKRIYIDPKTGKKLYTELPSETYINKAGKEVERTRSTYKLADTDDAFTLSSGSTMENVYAEHSNKLKGLANQARLDMINTVEIDYSPSANKQYSKEVDSLNSKLTVAKKNSPLERQAQLIANAEIKMKKEAHPEMDASDLKKVKAMAINDARINVGAKKQQIEITPSEWEAIQNGAVSKTKLNEILNNADLNTVKELATPRENLTLPTGKQNMIKTLSARGYTNAEIADHLGISTTTVNKYK